MGKFIDETGNKYGKLTVLKKSNNKTSSGCIKWLCQCDCGNITEVSGDVLRRGKTISCGCYQKNKVLKNEIGNRYGKLTVLRQAASRNHRAYWVCQCDCGNLCEISGTNLRLGQTSCGCNQIKNRIGLQYGKLKVINQKPNNMWECLCDCGNTITVFGKYLDNGHVLSCGCIKSKGETKIKEILIKLNISFETQKTFNSCRFEDTNQLARFDFYLPDYNIIIEYDGEQHFHSKNSGWSNDDQLIYTQNHDKFKNLWCYKNNIKIIRIPYTLFDKISEEYIKNLIKD